MNYSAHATGSVNYMGAGTATTKTPENPKGLSYLDWSNYFHPMPNATLGRSWRLLPDGSEIVMTDGFGKHLRGN